MDCSPLRLPEPAIDPRKHPLRPRKLRCEPQGVLQRPHRFFELLLAHERGPQKEMAMGIAKLQADALFCGLFRLLGLAGVKEPSGKH